MVIYGFLVTDFLTTVVFLTVLDIVSTFTLGVSATNLAVSVLAVSVLVSVSTVVLLDDDESTLLESAEPPLPLPLQAAKDKEMAAARHNVLNVFFIIGVVLRSRLYNRQG
jgi:hypothetical protein